MGEISMVGLVFIYKLLERLGKKSVKIIHFI